MTLLEDQNNDTWIEEIQKKEYEILNLKTELQNAMTWANQQRDEIASLEETIDKYHKLGEKQQEEIEKLKGHFYQVCYALGIEPSDIDDIEDALNTNENLEAEIQELKDSEVPRCVFDTMEWMALKLDLKAGVVGIPTSVARGLYKINTRLGRDERRFDEETILNGLRWLQDNFDR